MMASDRQKLILRTSLGAGPGLSDRNLLTQSLEEEVRDRGIVSDPNLHRVVSKIFDWGSDYAAQCLRAVEKSSCPELAPIMAAAYVRQYGNAILGRSEDLKTIRELSDQCPCPEETIDHLLKLFTSNRRSIERDDNLPGLQENLPEEVRMVIGRAYNNSRVSKSRKILRTAA